MPDLLTLIGAIVIACWIGAGISGAIAAYLLEDRAFVWASLGATALGVLVGVLVALLGGVVP